MRVFLVIGLFLLPALATAQPGERVEKARAELVEFLKRKGAAHGEIVAKTEKPVRATLPEEILFAVRFRQFPLAQIVPEGLGAANLFTIGADGKVRQLLEVKDLEGLVRERGVPVKSEMVARTALAAWLDLGQEFVQDGFFKFEIMDKEFAVEKQGDRLVARGRAILMLGGNGEINATLTFDDQGKLSGAQQTAKLRRGPRPICQATKLLDADPLVRRMAEADLLIMGLAAQPYLRVQRALAGPELQQAIDRLWRRIEANGW